MSYMCTHPLHLPPPSPTLSAGVAVHITVRDGPVDRYRGEDKVHHPYKQPSAQ